MHDHMNFPQGNLRIAQGFEPWDCECTIEQSEFVSRPFRFFGLIAISPKTFVI